MKTNLNKKRFYILGFQKSGTSTIHKWLEQIDNINLPANKETHYFSNDKYYSNGSKWYEKQFNSSNENQSHIGEVDPSYILKKEYMQRIREYSSDNLKFIFILRKPLERSYSQYLMSKLRGYENLPFAQALNKENERLLNDDNNFSLINHSYILRSNYKKHIESFRTVFPKSDVLFLKFDDILKANSRKKMLIKIVDFLEVQCNIEHINIDLEENLASEPRSKVFQNILYKDYLLKKMFKRLFTDRVAAKIKNILSSFNKKTINNKKTFNMMNNMNKEYLKWDNDIVHETEKITNLNLSNWYYDI